MKKSIVLAACAALIAATAGFIIPNLVDETQEAEERDVAYLGVNLGPALQDSDTEGAAITMVLPGSPAYQAGLMRGDVVIEVNGTPVTDNDSLTEIIRSYKPEDEVEIVVLRHGKQQRLHVELGRQHRIMTRHNNGEPFVFSMRNGDGAEFTALRNMWRGYRLGVSYEELSPELGEYFGRPNGTGVLITSVEPDSPAEEAGLRPGDVIISLDGHTIDNGRDLQKALEAEKDGEETLTVDIGIIRKNAEMTLQAEVEAGSGPFIYSLPALRKGIVPRIHLEKFFNNHKNLKEKHREMLNQLEGIELPDFDVIVENALRGFDMDALELKLEDIELLGPHIEQTLLDAFEGIDMEALKDMFDNHISISIEEDGSVIVNGRRFESIDALNSFIREEQPAGKQDTSQASPVVA